MQIDSPGRLWTEDERRQRHVRNCTCSFQGTGYNSRMSEPILIVTVQQDKEDGILVTFSDGTTAGYVVEELLELRPIREKAKPISPGRLS